MEEIAIHTMQQWGIEQSFSYIDGFTKAFETLAENQHLGSACDDIQPGYRQFPVKAHSIYYRIDRGAVIIVRIIHQSRNALHIDF